MHSASFVRNFSASQITGIAWTKPGQAALGTLGYGYDALGRRVAQTGTYASQLLPEASRGSNTFDDNNRQTRHDGKTLSYDANGNLLSDGQRTYHWNARNQLVAIKVGDSVQASFQYDPLGRRISKTEGGQTITYLYDGMDIVQERMGNTVNPILTGPGIDQRFARNEGSERTYFLTDALGSTRALTNAAGEVVQRYDYTPYGQTRTLNAGMTNPYQYTGRERDGSGIYYYRARYYSPGTGRFISEDPIGLRGGTNTYAYVEGDPITFSDPLGLEKLILLPATDPSYPAAVSAVDIPGQLDIYAHGNPSQVAHHGVYELANLVGVSGLWEPGMPIKLNSCRSAQGEDNIAKKLSVVLNTQVTGADTTTVTFGSRQLGPWNTIRIPFTVKTIPYSRGNWVTYPAGGME